MRIIFRIIWFFPEAIFETGFHVQVHWTWTWFDLKSNSICLINAEIENQVGILRYSRPFSKETRVMYIPAPQMTLKVNLAQMLPIFRWINYKNKKDWYKSCIYYPRCSKFVLWRKKIVAKFLHNRMILSSRIFSLFRFTSAFRCFL